MLRYEQLLGLEFDIERRNCFHLVRDFYGENFGIEFADYACPTDWWDRGMDLYSRLAHAEGFQIVHDHPRDWRPGDVIAMAIRARVANHIAVLLPGGNILHHLVGQRSCVTPYGGMFRNTTVAIYRHPRAVVPAEPTVNFREVLPPHVQRRLEELEGARASAAGEAPART